MKRFLQFVRMFSCIALFGNVLICAAHAQYLSACIMFVVGVAVFTIIPFMYRDIEEVR